MVKAVVGDETQLKLAEDRLSQSAVSSQVGLVIGKLNSRLDRGFVFDLIPTPVNDGGEPPCSVAESFRDDKKKGSKGKATADSSILVIDKDWVAEHARQVSRMLMGGVKVIGIYIWVTDSLFKNSTISLCQTVKGVAEAASFLEADLDERLLIHISYSPRRWTCRNCMLTANITSSSLRTCDFKMGRVLSSLQTFRCMYNFDLRLPICHENASSARTLGNVLQHGISAHAKELDDAKAMVDGTLVAEDEPCTSDGLHEVELLLPFIKDASAQGCNRKDVGGVLVFHGSVCSFAYLNSKEPISQAVADIKGDIITSLRSRLDIVCDETDGDPTLDVGIEATNVMSNVPTPHLNLQELRKTCSLSFPRRVFVPWLAGTYICDYLQPSETLEVVKEHCVELMSIEAPTDASMILQPEREAAPLVTIGSFWDVAVFSHSASSADFPSANNNKINADRKEISKKSIKKADFNTIAALLALLLSILVGSLFYFNGS